MKITSIRFMILLSIACAMVFQQCTPYKQSSSGSHVARQRGTYTYEGGDGMSFESAVIILEKSSGSGIDAEYAWIDLHYPGSSILGQSLQRNGSHTYDVIEFKDANRKKVTAYFQIDNFFGKW